MRSTNHGADPARSGGRLCELVTAAENGQRVVITKGEPSVRLVRCERKQRGGLDWDRLNANRRRLGIKDAPPGEVEAVMAAFRDSALSRRVLGLEIME